MAKYEKRLTGDFDAILSYLHEEILARSDSASFEDGSDFDDGPFRVAVRVYERYSFTGSNRVSLNLTLAGQGRKLFLSAITSGGSQAMFLKINTLGESAFLDKLVELVDELERNGVGA